MKEFIKNLYQKLQNTKVHLWSHALMITGWIYILTTILFIITDMFLYLLFMTIIWWFSIISNLIWYFIETVYIQEPIIYWKFLTQNKFYNLIWIIGITSNIAFNIFIFLAYIVY